jgi:acyl carrier protein
MKKRSAKEVHETIVGIFASTLGVKPTSITPSMAYNSHPKWDSFKHLELIGDLEGTFNIDIRKEDVIKMDTFKKMEDIVTSYLR